MDHTIHHSFGAKMTTEPSALAPDAEPHEVNLRIWRYRVRFRYSH
jgi:hypothetical protein